MIRRIRERDRERDGSSKPKGQLNTGPSVAAVSRCIPTGAEAGYRDETDVARARFGWEICSAGRALGVVPVAGFAVGWLRNLEGGLEQPHRDLHLRSSGDGNGPAG